MRAYHSSTKTAMTTPHKHLSTTPSSKSSSNKLLGITLALMLATGAFLSGLHFGSTELASKPSLIPSGQLAGFFSSWFGPDSTPDEEVDMEQFWRVWNVLDDKFVFASSTKTLSKEERVMGAIDGLVRSYGDPYTIFLPPKETEQFEADISGEFSGVGMEVGMRNGLISVIAPLPETPAERAGILSGDVIVKIDGVLTDNMTIDQAVKRIRGEQGTEVVLTIFRDGATELQDITIVRDKIDIPTVKTERLGDVFVIRLYSFNAISESRMEAAIKEYVSSGGGKMVLDLRDNPGGFLQSAVSIASHFLPAGKVVVKEHFGGDTEDQLFRSQGRLLRQYSPDDLVVLVNGGSASASEILAGALSQHKVATLIGDTTFGKGSVQELVDLPGGSSLKVTIARWLTPDGTSISDGGLEPDIKIERTAEQYLNNEDPQLDAAIEWLNGKRDFGTSSSPLTQLIDR